VSAFTGRHRWRGAILPGPPDDAERTSYEWRALTYLTAGLFISSICVVLAQALMEIRNASILPAAAALFGTYTLVYVVYQAVSLPVNFAGRSFDLPAHDALTASWQPRRYPDVDVYLPICGEPTDVLRNTWTGVFELIQSYPGWARAYVLDDGDSDEARSVASSYGLCYIRRPVHEHKKAGNLNYAFRLTTGEHIVIFDADFRPRPDFLAETLPYMDDPTVGIVQTPQFFRVSARQTWIERAAGTTLEVFYRAVQVSRDRFGSALCVGSCAVYRRAALEPSGGFTLIPYAEDSHTGLDTRRHGYQLRYVPVPLAAGICPSSLDAFMRQQYRWCCGATSLVWTRHMWSVPMPWKSRLPYVAGWLWNLTTALRTLILPLIPITLLAFLPAEIQLRNALLLLPAVLTGTVLYPLWHNAPYSPRIWPLSLAVGWAQILAIWDYSRGKVMSWQPSRGPGDATRRFWWGVTMWNGSLAIAWLGLAAWRIEQTGSPRFGVVAAFGILNVLIVARLIFPGRNAA
jgi:cellulose synthase (UDP-forming)